MWRRGGRFGGQNLAASHCHQMASVSSLESTRFDKDAKKGSGVSGVVGSAPATRETIEDAPTLPPPSTTSMKFVFSRLLAQRFTTKPGR